MNSKTRAALVKELARSTATGTPYDLAGAELQFAQEDWVKYRIMPIIDRLLAARDAEIRELLLSDGAKNASAHRMQELSAQGVWRNHTLAFYGMKAALEHIGLAEEGEER